MDRHGGNQIQLTRFQDDGQQAGGIDIVDARVVYHNQNASASKTGEVYVANVDQSGETRLTDNGVFDMGPRLSPDGSRILYNSPDTHEMMLMSPDGSGKTVLVGPPYECYSGIWSPDGTQIVYTCSDGDPHDIWRMNADGTERVNLTDTPTVDEGARDWR